MFQEIAINLHKVLAIAQGFFEKGKIIMILYYSGTGNSRYVALRIADQLQDECLDLFTRLRDNDYCEIASQKPFVLVTPTYGWQIPRLLQDWLKKVQFTGNKKLYFVMTCGSEIGNSAQYLRKLCAEIGMSYKGCAEIVMPENYIALFDAPDQTEALTIIEKAKPLIDQCAQVIKVNDNLTDKPVNVNDKIKSSIVNAAFYPLIVHAKKFYVTNECTGCGKCVKSCVLSNIQLIEHKPVWGNHCTHCMACICGCPAHAIEYGNASLNKPRYQCPE